MNALEEIGKLGIIPVVKINEADHASQLAEALCRGALPCAEITFRTDEAENAIRLISASHPQLIVGAGTVVSVSMAEKAVNAGARFIVSPGFDPKMVDWCIGNRIPVVPGIATCTEALMAIDKGLAILKFFPSESLGGLETLEAIAAALIGIKFIPTGGISPTNMANYLRSPLVHAVAGSWLAAADMISSGEFGKITALAAEAIEIVQRERRMERPL
jgi:2-dehydro-3-deoxyphosphogluconate aldolase/(4S)-4-hydroxy-2-oxoglutarate aldolase